MGWLSGARQESFARRDLDALGRRLHAAGLSTTTLSPQLLACVDQHSAAIRDILTFSGNHVGAIDLAAYAQGVVDAAADTGWAPETHTGPLDPSTTTGWIALRLLAVCALADASVSARSGTDDTDPLLFT